MHRALAGLAAGLVLGGMMLGTSRAEDMYRPGGLIPGGVPATFNITAVVSGTNTTASWYGPHGWYTVQATTNYNNIIVGPYSNLATTAATSYNWSVNVNNQGITNGTRVLQNNGFAGSGACSGCHGDKYSQYATTLHSAAYNNLSANTNYPLTSLTVGAGQPTGFTDITNTPHLANVGCENCHGPAAWHKYSDHNLILPAVSIDPQICGGCHTGPALPQYDEYVTTKHAQVNDDIKYGFNTGIYYTNTIVMKGSVVTNAGALGSSNVYGFYVTTNANLTLKTNATTGIIHSQYGSPSYVYDPGQDRAAGCGVCHSGAARMAMLKDYENRLSGITNALAMPTRNDSAAWGPTCAVCHDPHPSNTNTPSQLRYPTVSTNFYTMPTTADKRTILTTNSMGAVTTSVVFMNSAFASFYNTNVQVCGQCHNSRGARWDGNSYGLVTNPVTQAVGVDVVTSYVTYTKAANPGVLFYATNSDGSFCTNSSGYGRAPHHSMQYNMLIGIIENDYYNTNSSGVATNRMQTHGSGTADQCATCHVPTYTSGTNLITGHTFELDYSGCMTVSGSGTGCHSSYSANSLTAKIVQTQLSTTNSIIRIASLLNQWATNKAPDILRTNYGTLAWEFTAPGELGATNSLSTTGPLSAYSYKTNAGWTSPSYTNDNQQLMIPADIRRARFNVYTVLHDQSLGVHNPTYIPLLLADAESRVASFFPKASFTATPTSGILSSSNTFAVVFTCSGAGVTNCAWTFGDGNSANTTGLKYTNTYTTSGTFSVTLTVTDTNGASETMTRANYIMIGAYPSVSFVANVTSGPNPTTVIFTNTSSNTGDVTRWRWGMGSQSFYTAPSDGNTFTYTFTNGGLYTITLRPTVAGASGSTATSNNYVVIAGPSSSFSAATTKGLVPLTITFTNTSTGATNYFWDFGDGNTSTSTNPANIYTNAGTYTVTLYATGSGVTNVLTRASYIAAYPKSVSFTGAPTVGVVPLTVYFTNLSTNSTSYLWSFGDGNTSTNQNPSNTYTNVGSNTVTLTAIAPTPTNALVIKTNTLVLTNYIVVNPAPVANFTNITPRNGWAPLTVTFTNTSANAFSYVWNFGDGKTSASVNPSNTYTNAGDYHVTLSAISYGVTNTLVRDLFVHVAAPY